MAALPASALRTVSGWGRYPRLQCTVQRPEKLSELAEAVTGSGPSGILARGLGRSYGDAACHPNLTILTERFNRMLAFDERTGVLRCEAGVTLADVLQTFVPRGWFPPVVPGTKFVTLGGALACDVHGKNHHRDGSFSNFVRSFRLLTASGVTVDCSPTEKPDLFWATAGGMGLTGVITEVEVQLRPITSSFVVSERLPARHLDEAMELFDEREPGAQYSVAWVDTLARGRSLGRSILFLGNHAAAADVRQQPSHRILKAARSASIPVPLDLPDGLLNRITIGAFNALYYAANAHQPSRRVVPYEPFFFPLDRFRDWNRLYGRSGFVQYQCVVPLEGGPPALRRLLELSAAEGRSAFLAVLKRFGQQGGLLSFPMPGWTLALDFPVKPGLMPFLERLDQVVVDAGGRIYLAKDARLPAARLGAMYPKLGRWREIKAAVDPGSHFNSALARRLRLVDSDRAMPLTEEQAA